MQWASTTGQLHGSLEAMLANEAGAPHGYLHPVPQDGGDGSLDTLRATLKGLKGRSALVETTAGGWGQGMAVRPQRDWQHSRAGMDPPEVLATIRGDTADAIFRACGVPEALVNDADGTAQREAYRRWVMAAVSPMADQLAAELSEKLETPISFRFDGLWAHDTAGRASALASLVQAGMSLDDALAKVGL